jgi:hypothetical protein
VLVTLIATGLKGQKQAPTMQAEALSGDLPGPITAANPPPKRPGRSAKEATPPDAVEPPIEVADEAEQPSPTLDEDDLEVPSFLRRRSQRTGRD